MSTTSSSGTPTGPRSTRTSSWKLDRRGKPWKNLWEQLHAQRNEDFAEDDELQVVVAERNQLLDDCVEMAERSLAENVDEWVKRLTTDQVTILDDIVKHVGTRNAALEVFQKVTFLHWTDDHIQDEFARRRLAAGAGGPSTLLTTLRDIVSSGRAPPHPVPGRATYAAVWNLSMASRSLNHPNGGCLPTARLSRISAASASPVQREAEQSMSCSSGQPRDLQPDGLHDFEDEDLGSWREPERNAVDLGDFPQPEFDRLVVIAGPGCGKSALLTALATRLAPGPFVPVEIPMALLAASGKNVLAFLEEHVKDEFNVTPRWERLAEQGLLVLLLDGLDEIPASQRQRVLRRIATFSSRYEHCPWLLTAHDPAVVTGLPYARQLELAPLADSDIAEFVRVIASQLDSVDATQFVRKLRLYPDLDRLARIPLFLTMLLATTDARALEPTKRSDLIEAYLKTLITPEEHKAAQPATPLTLLRPIAQDIAYRRIEAQEIGVSETEVRAVIAEHTEDASAAESTFQALRSNGILRQQGPARLTFPYPIVQEYLAACHLVKHDAETLSSRIENAVSRPWAQVMQFAVELHQDPEPLIEEILLRDDDAFFTGLRLVGRCVVNGATVSAETHRRIGQRLVAAWQKAPSRAREAIGRLLCDGFTGDNLDELTEAVHRYWLQHSGAGEIVSRINDPQLTLSVVKALTEQDPSNFKVYRSLRPAIEQVRAQALALVRDLILEADDAAREARSSVLTNFGPHSDLAEIALEIARNEDLPVNTRLRAYALTPTPLLPDGQALLDEAIRTQQCRLSYEASCLLQRLDDPQRYLAEALASDEFTDEWKHDLIQSLTGVFPDADTRQAFLAEARSIVDETEIELRSALDVVAAGAGDQAAIARLIADIDKNPLHHVGMSISLLGNYRDADLAETAAQTGAGAIRRAGGHCPAVQPRSHRNASQTGTQLRIRGARAPGTTPSRHRPLDSPRRRLVPDRRRDRAGTHRRADVGEPPRRRGGTNPTRAGRRTDHGPERSKMERRQLARSHRRTCRVRARRRKPLLDKDFLDSLLRADQINLLMTGVHAMSAHGDRDALQRLLVAHREHLGWHERDQLANAVEVLSLKLGFVVRLEDGQFEMPDRAQGRRRS